MTNKEILDKLRLIYDFLERDDIYQYSGICTVMCQVFNDINDVKIIEKIIFDNIKKRRWFNISNKPYYKEKRDDSYFWEPWNKEPRLKYLEYLIEKYEKL